ncbi:EAST1 family heat-stable enterotoxin [Pluralibacter gergoviae]|uniref:EAST1 family heat-stable enterotoxin n=1 Tax=Pluralibacter gergoviae TaxID=61647 RepID=UPI00155E90D0|nr:EAST1 family heat-stable enterotoxin [Pluralibacter gergoviae]
MAGRNEGAKFWLNVLTELKNRGLNDILIACVDGLKGFPDAINAVYPEARISCASYIWCATACGSSPRKITRPFRDLKAIYQCRRKKQVCRPRKCSPAPGQPLSADKPELDGKLVNLATFFGYPADIRKVIYTTNA